MSDRVAGTGSRLPDFARSRAVLIGAHTYTDPELPDVPSIRRNVDRLATLLRDERHSGFDETTCRTVDNPETVDELLSPIAEAASTANDVLAVYFSGHGILVGEDLTLHLAVGGTRIGRFWTSAEFAQVARIINGSSATTKVVILDCCYSGRVLGQVLSDAGTGGVEQADVEGSYVMTSTSATKPALAPDSELYTAFTGQLIKVFEEGLGTAGELLPLIVAFDAVAARMARRGHPAPQQRHRNQGGALALVRNPRFRAPAGARPPISDVPLRAPKRAKRLEEPPSTIVLSADRWGTGEMPAAVAGADVDPGPEELFALPPEEASAEATATPQRIPDVGAALRDLDRAVVVGPPGSGKSTLLLTVLAGRTDDDPIPVLVPLQQFTGRHTDGHRQRFAQFVADLTRQQAAGADRSAVRLLIDGLDELPHNVAGEALRTEVLDLLATRPRWLLTTRSPAGVPAVTARAQIFHLRELDPPQIRDILVLHGGAKAGSEAWYRVGGDDRIIALWQRFADAGHPEAFWAEGPGLSGLTDPAESETLHRVAGSSSLLRLCRNPYLAYLVAKLYLLEGDLPSARAELLDRFVWALLRKHASRTGTAGNAAAVHQAMRPLAYAMNKAGVLVLSHADARILIGDRQADSYLQAAVDAGVLRLGLNRISFAHRLIRDVFAYVCLRSAMDLDLDAEEFFPRDAWWVPNDWLAPAALLGDAVQPVDRVARWLAPAEPVLALRLALTAGAQRRTPAELDADTHSAIVRACRNRESDPHPAGRAHTWRVLGQLGEDRRRGVGCGPDGLPDITWVRVPGMDLQIAKYPVTNAQFEAFRSAPDGRDGSSGRFADDPHAPRESVTWYEAAAFAEWLGRRTGSTVGLPTEREWHAAARSALGLPFPWGDWQPGRCNTRPSSIGRTSPVGIFPEGAAACGAEDLCGNVWEWCLPDDPAVGVATVRGGSWADYTHHARVDFSASHSMSTALDSIGFRLVRRSYGAAGERKHLDRLSTPASARLSDKSGDTARPSLAVLHRRVSGLSVQLRLLPLPRSLRLRGTRTADDRRAGKPGPRGVSA